MGGALAYNRSEIDVMVLDKDGRPAVLVEVYAGSRQTPEDIESHVRWLRTYSERTLAPYMILVTLSKVMVWRRDQQTEEPACMLDTETVLQEYMAFEDRPIVGHLLLSIAAKQWLQDLMIHWKSSTPPFEGEMKEVGLLDAISGGDIVIGAAL
jgi:hypothetical protein